MPTPTLVSWYFKPIKELLTKGGVNNIYVNRFDQILYDQNGETKIWDKSWADEEALCSAIKNLAISLSQPIDKDEPLLDGVMPDGSRINAGLPPILKNSYLTIRVFPEDLIDWEKLISWNSVSAHMVEFLKLSVLTRRNMLVSGGTGSGKTTILQALMDEVPKAKRLVVIEDTRELRCRDWNCLQLEAPKRKDKTGNQLVTMGRLVTNAMRQTPDNLIVGEMREADSAVAFRELLNTGHSGIISTLHADSAVDAIYRLRDLIQEGQASTPNEVILSSIRKSINIILQSEHSSDGGKRVVTLAEMFKGGLESLFWWDYELKAHVCNESLLRDSYVWSEAKKLGLDLSWMSDYFKVYHL